MSQDTKAELDKISGQIEKLTGFIYKEMPTRQEISQQLDPVKTRLSAIEGILAVHTTALEKLLTEKKSREDEKLISAERFDRLEHWAVLAGNKLGIKLEL